MVFPPRLPQSLHYIIQSCSSQRLLPDQKDASSCIVPTYDTLTSPWEFHEASYYRSITVFSCSVGNTFPCLFNKEPKSFWTKFLINMNQSSQPHGSQGYPCCPASFGEGQTHRLPTFTLRSVTHSTHSNIQSFLNPGTTRKVRIWYILLDINKLSSSTA